MTMRAERSWNDFKPAAERKAARAARFAEPDALAYDAAQKAREHLAAMNEATLAQDPEEMWGSATCELCGEHFQLRKIPLLGEDTGFRLEWQEVGEFVIETDGETSHVIAHAECGLNNGLELA